MLDEVFNVAFAILILVVFVGLWIFALSGGCNMPEPVYEWRDLGTVLEARFSWNTGGLFNRTNCGYIKTTVGNYEMYDDRVIERAPVGSHIEGRFQIYEHGGDRLGDVRVVK